MKSATSLGAWGRSVISLGICLSQWQLRQVIDAIGNPASMMRETWVSYGAFSRVKALRAGVHQ